MGGRKKFKKKESISKKQKKKRSSLHLQESRKRKPSVEMGGGKEWEVGLELGVNYSPKKKGKKQFTELVTNG